MVVQGSGTARFFLSEQIVFHERQGSDRLCGQHVINMICQQPKISSSDLRKAADRLDSNESMLLGQNPLTQFKGENASADGYFNVSVIEYVLLHHAQIAMTVFTDRLDDVSKSPDTKGEGFLINKSDHWYCWRKIKDVWYEFDSMRDAPEKLTNETFKSRLMSGKAVGTVFYLYKTDGSPMPIPDDWVTDLKRNKDSLASHQKLMTEEEREKLYAAWAAKKNPKSSDTDALWQGTGQALGSVQPSHMHDPLPVLDLESMTEEEQLAYVIKMSEKDIGPTEKAMSAVELEEEPQSGCTIAVRVAKGPNSGRHTRKFIPESKAEQVLAWLNTLLDGASGRMTTSVPPVKSYQLTQNDIKDSSGSSIRTQPINMVLLSKPTSNGESFNLSM